MYRNDFSSFHSNQPFYIIILSHNDFIIHFSGRSQSDRHPDRLGPLEHGVRLLGDLPDSLLHRQAQRRGQAIQPLRVQEPYHQRLQR